MPGVGLILAIREARDHGRGLSEAETAEVAAAFDLALAKGATIDAGFGLAGGWRATFAAKVLPPDSRPVAKAGRVAADARDMRQRLLRYLELKQFDADLVKPPALGSERRRQYDLMIQFRGRVPEERTLRDWLTP